MEYGEGRGNAGPEMSTDQCKYPSYSHQHFQILFLLLRLLADDFNLLENKILYKMCYLLQSCLALNAFREIFRFYLC